VNRVYVRSENLADLIFNVKLPISHWKVLFAVDGQKDTRQLSEFLELTEEELEVAIQNLTEKNLISVSGAQVETEEAPLKQEAVEEPQDTETQAEETPETATEKVSEAELDAAIQKDLEKEQIEEPSEKLEFPSKEEEFLEDFLETEEELPTETPPEESTGIEEKETTGTEAVQEETDEEFDRLIGDLLGEEEKSEAAEETLKTSFEVDETLEAEKETPPAAEEEKKEEAPEAPPVSEKPEEEVAQPESKEEGEFDFGSMFQEDLKETEETLSDLMGALEEEITMEEPEAPPTVPPTTEEAVPSKTILVVDDSVVIRKMVEIALENEKYNIVSVATGKEALKFIDENEPDLVILDIMLPDVNGLDILKAIKASKSTPVVMLSAKDTPRETSKAKELGADDFIPKPFKDEELVLKVKELIGG